MSKLDTKNFNEKLEEVVNKLDSAAKINVALRLALRTIQGKVENFDIVEQSAQERQNTKWRLKLITNNNFFALLNFRNVNFRNFEELSIDDLPLVEGIVEGSIFHYDFDIQEGEYVGE